MKLILDIECTRQTHPVSGRDDPSPYNSKNKLVYVGVCPDDATEPFGIFFHHKDKPEPSKEQHEKLQALLNKSELVIGHNLKFDMSWLYECGFMYNGPLYDTMICEYINNKGMKTPLSLKELAIKYNLPHKLDILEDYWLQGVNTDAVPCEELEHYALQDIQTTRELYNFQEKRNLENVDSAFMEPAIQLTNEALPIIIEMERNGCYIDRKALEEVEQEYVNELTILNRGIRAKINDLMGDTPINLDSPDDMSMLLYGFELNDKKKWVEMFGIGTSERNSVKKRKYPKYMSPNEFKRAVRDNTTAVFKTEAEQCSVCEGHKMIRKIKKDNTPFKKPSKCYNCNAIGFVYNVTDKPAGLRLKPISSNFVTASGFAADKKVIEQYLSRESLDDEVKAFLRALQRQSAITTYLSTFVEGIKNNAREDRLLHTSLNQCITATGRLSSSNPNFQNLPRGSTFPVRKAIRSRFDGGNILEVDFAGLEYRVAVMLAGCEVGLQSIISGKDRHEITANIIYQAYKDRMSKEEWKQYRQSAKAHTFKPLYYGQSGTEAEKRYYAAFMDEHIGIRHWHEKLGNEAIRDGQIKTPTHRIFAFPNAKRNFDGKIKGMTQIVNYPVQSVATADIIWIVLIEIYKQMKKLNLRSKLILQVHDAVVADIHPNEKDIMIDLFKKAFDKTHELLYTRYSYHTDVPIGYEMSIGPNWGSKIEIAV